VPDLKAVDRFVDVAGVALISVAAVLTAICGYQSGRWSGAQTRDYNVANAHRVESAEAADRGFALTAIDVNLFLHYVDAVSEGNTRDADFIHRRFRPEMRPAMKAWLATKPLTNPHAPSSPFVMPQYTLATNLASHKLAAQASRDFDAAQLANRHADDFLLLTVIFASVSFLAGMSTKLIYPRHAIVIALGLVGLVYGLIRLVELPFM
jgi:hypothetical protein